jgi:hypothetical protein
MAKETQQPPNPVLAGKQMHEDPTHGHRQLSAEERAEALGSKGSFDTTGLKADPPPAGGMSPEAILAMDISQIPDDPKAIEALLGTEFGDKSREKGPEGDAQVHQQAEAIQTGKAKPFEAAAPAEVPDDSASKAKDESTTKPTTTPAAASTDNAEGEFVESRDGKGRIPYTVLANTRRQLAAANAKIASFEAGQNQPAGAVTPTASQKQEVQEAREDAEKGLLTQEKLAEFRTRFPDDLIDVIEALNTKASSAFNELQEIKQAAAEEERAELQTKAQTVQDLIDQDPVLAQWQQADDPADWEEAVKIDESLRATRRWGEKPFAERMVEVKRLMGVEPAAAGPTAAQLADQRLKDAAAKQTQGRAFTHSDLPGGQAPAQTERELVSGLSSMELASRMEQMTPVQLERFLASV